MTVRSIYRFNIYMIVLIYFIISYYIEMNITIDSIIISILLCMLWYYYFSDRLFVMGLSDIESRYSQGKINWYCIKGEDQVSIDRVYLKGEYDEYWKELEYGIILERGDLLKKFDDCQRYYDTFGKLGAEFRFKLSDIKKRRLYMDKVQNKRIYGGLSLIFLLLIGYIYWVVIYPMF